MPHIHEKIDFTVSVYIVCQEKVLLHIHKKHKRWLPVGGHIELHEDPNEAALREAKEESGLDVTFLNDANLPKFNDYGSHKQLFLPNFIDRHEVQGVTPYHEHVDSIYFATSTSQDSTAEDNGTQHWFSNDELENKEFSIPTKIIFYAREALRAAKL